MLFVHDDQADILDGCKDCGSGSDYDARSSLLHATPLIVAFSFRQPRVKNGDLLAETADEDIDNLCGEGDFRQQNDGASPKR